MKKLNLIVISFATILILFLASCEKDGNGIPLKYYENLTGEGYVFEKRDNEIIIPNLSVRVWANIKGGYSHFDDIQVDNNGKYTCRFLEKRRPNIWFFGKWEKVSFYTFFALGNYTVTCTADTIRNIAKKATKKNPQVIHIDTIWIER